MWRKALVRENRYIAENVFVCTYTKCLYTEWGKWVWIVAWGERNAIDSTEIINSYIQGMSCGLYFNRIICTFLDNQSSETWNLH